MPEYLKIRIKSNAMATPLFQISLSVVSNLFFIMCYLFFPHRRAASVMRIVAAKSATVLTTKSKDGGSGNRSAIIRFIPVVHVDLKLACPDEL